MPVIPMKPILDAAERYGYGQGAFNVNTISQIKAALEIHEVLKSPAIIQGAELANGFMGGAVDFKTSSLTDIAAGARRIGDAVWKYAEKSPIPVALHLDHGTNLEVIKACIDGGYTSVMIDGSSKPYDDNLEITREVVRYAHKRGVTVEGELGVLAGVEDHVFSENSTYTSPLQALDFVRKTGVDALAISYGTMHGPNKGKNVKLRREIVVAIKELFRHEGVDVAVVSHGSSTIPRYLIRSLESFGATVNHAEGIPLEEIQKAIGAGISKINIDTDIRLAVTRNVRSYFSYNREKRTSLSTYQVYNLLEQHPGITDPRAFLGTIMDSVFTDEYEDKDIAAIHFEIERGVKEIIAQLLVSFGSVGQQDRVKLTTMEQMAKQYSID